MRAESRTSRRPPRALKGQPPPVALRVNASAMARRPFFAREELANARELGRRDLQPAEPAALQHSVILCSFFPIARRGKRRSSRQRNSILRPVELYYLNLDVGDGC